MTETGSEKYFENNYRDYDEWYSKHPKEYSDQLNFLREIIPPGKGIEIGVGTGRFASALGIEYGIDRSEAMVSEASRRGVIAAVSDAESVPFRDDFFDYAFSIVTLCFLERPEAVLSEARRIAKYVITVILDRDTDYIRGIMKNPRGFYVYARFYSEGDLVSMYEKLGFQGIVVKRKDLRTSDGIHYRLVSVTGR